MKKDIYFEILQKSYKKASLHINHTFIKDEGLRRKIEQVALCLRNRAGVRALLACLLAKIKNPEVDVRKPYTGIDEEKQSDSFSGRFLDENYIQKLLEKPFCLPINSTTAFLTPGFRTKNMVLSLDVSMEGRPEQMYKSFLSLLDDVFNRRVSAQLVMHEVLRMLILERDKRKESIDNLLIDIQRTADHLPLSAEDIVVLLSQHLSCRNSSRLPVLIVAAAYKAASRKLGERILKLQSHTAADKQTGALADLEIAMIDDNQVVTAYEMKMKPVMNEDINLALRKIAGKPISIQNYIFITTAPIDADVAEYAREKYDETGGIEFAILDCLGFLRHFLHLFFRIRYEFLNCYQELLLTEPDSSVGHALKETFLSLRKTAEGAR
jgi:DNA adenine methylase